MKTKKLALVGTIILAIGLIMGIMAPSVLAASNPTDDAGSYSYNAGKQSYTQRMTQSHPWFDNEDEATTSDYSFNTGSQATQERNNAFDKMPTGDDLDDEELDAFFKSHNIGGGAAWSNGQYDDGAKNSYGYTVGHNADQQRHATFI